jgi:hypothetical protein
VHFGLIKFLQLFATFQWQTKSKQTKLAFYTLNIYIMQKVY